jgi:hypothetical protein
MSSSSRASLASVKDTKEPIAADPHQKHVEPDPASETSSLEIVNYPWRVKGPALLCVLMFTSEPPSIRHIKFQLTMKCSSVGSNWATAALSPLKSTLKKELKINNAQYGVVSSAQIRA